MNRPPSPSHPVLAVLAALGAVLVAVNSAADEPTRSADTAVERCAQRLVAVANDSARVTAERLRDELALTLGPCDDAIKRLGALSRSTDALAALSDLRLPPGCAASLGAPLLTWAEGLPHDLLRAAVTSLVNADPAPAGVLLPRLLAPKTLDTVLQALFDVEAPLPTTIWSQVAAAPALPTLTVESRLRLALRLERSGDVDGARRLLNALPNRKAKGWNPYLWRQRLLLDLSLTAAAAKSGDKAAKTALAKAIAAVTKGVVKAAETRPDAFEGAAEIARAWAASGDKSLAMRLATEALLHLAEPGPEPVSMWNPVRFSLYETFLLLGDTARAAEAMTSFYNHNYAFTVPALGEAARVAASLGLWDVAAGWSVGSAPRSFYGPDLSPLQCILRDWVASAPPRDPALLDALTRAVTPVVTDENGPPRAAYVALAEAWLEAGKPEKSRELLAVAGESPAANLPAGWVVTADARAARVLARLGDDTASRDAWTRALNAALAEPDAVGRLMALTSIAAEIRSAVDHRVLDAALGALPNGRCDAPEAPLE
ncbi:MAG: hypothetical protein IV100_33660 [Myxococcales bacterium]|nr:hypothetical protein [Myxococcales bacterium]